MQGKALLLINGKAKQTYVFSLKQICLFVDPEKEINQELDEQRRAEKRAVEAQKNKRQKAEKELKHRRFVKIRHDPYKLRSFKSPYTLKNPRNFLRYRS